MDFWATSAVRSHIDLLSRSYAEYTYKYVPVPQPAWRKGAQLEVGAWGSFILESGSRSNRGLCTHKLRLGNKGAIRGVAKGTEPRLLRRGRAHHRPMADARRFGENGGKKDQKLIQ